MTVRRRILGIVPVVIVACSACASGRSAPPPAPPAPAPVAEESAPVEETATTTTTEPSLVFEVPPPTTVPDPFEGFDEVESPQFDLSADGGQVPDSPDGAIEPPIDDGVPGEVEAVAPSDPAGVPQGSEAADPEAASEAGDPADVATGEPAEGNGQPPTDLGDIPSGVVPPAGGGTDGVPERAAEQDESGLDELDPRLVVLRLLERAGDPLTPTAELADLAELAELADPAELADLAELADADVDAIRRAVAGNPATPARLLADLLKDKDPGVRWRAAANPAVWLESGVLPVRTLSLAEYFKLSPYTPTIPLDTEAAGLLDLDAVEQGLDDLLELWRAGNEIENEISDNDRVLDHLDSLPEPLVLLPGDPLPSRAIADNPAPWPAIVAVLVADYQARQWAAAEPSTPPDELLALAADPRGDVAVRVGANPSSPPEALALLIRSSDHPIRRVVSENPATPTDVLDELADDEVPGVRRGVARNPTTSAATLGELADDDDEYVRSAVAANAATPADVLGELADVGSFLVRLAVAGNPSAPSEALAALADDDDPGVRWAAANNPSTPSEALEQPPDGAGVIGRRGEPIDPPPPAPSDADEETVPTDEESGQSDAQ